MSILNRKLKALIGVVLGILSVCSVLWYQGQGLSLATACTILLVSADCGFMLMMLRKNDTRMRACCITLAIAFAVFCIFGYSFYLTCTPEMINGSRLRILKSGCAFLGYIIVFGLNLTVLFQFLSDSLLNDCKRKESGQSRSAYGRAMKRAPFRTTFLTLLLLYIPYIIASYPALFMGDTTTLLAQGFGVRELSTHHPLFYTLFLTAVIKGIRLVCSSWNSAVFVFSILQLLFFLSVMSLGIHILIKKTEVDWRWVLALELYYAFSPRISNCMFVISKDVYYAAFLLLLAEALFSVMKCKAWNRRNTLVFISATLGLLLLRNDGFYVVVISFLVFSGFHPVLRKRVAAFLACVVVLHVVFNQFVYPALNIKKGSVVEMLSIPLQQTARCTRYLGDSMTEEEKNEILSLFFFDTIEEMGNAYNPSLSDNIKYNFPYEISKEELSKYLKLWVSMGKKYPVTYLNAFINNYYEYVYPGRIFMPCSYEWSETCFERANARIDSDFHYPDNLIIFRNTMESIRELIFSAYPLKLINMPGSTTWILLIWAAFLLYHRKYEAFMLTIPLLVVMLVCIASPCNGYYCRYQYPLLPYIPWGMMAGGSLCSESLKL